MRIEVTGRIARRREDVYAYIADPRRLPAWNSAVRAVTALPGPHPGVGSRYLMRRDLPSGPAANELEIITMAPSTEFALRTVSGATPFTYRYRLSDTDGSGTLLELEADVELDGSGLLPSPLAARLVRRGIEANFRTLGAQLEQS